MSPALDYKKAYKHLYQPGTQPEIMDVPEMCFLAVDGRGNPNTAEAYKEALELLYGFSYAIKMSKMSGTQPPGYYEYTVFPLEGLWWFEGKPFLMDGSIQLDKEAFIWRSMIRQPEFVDESCLEMARKALARKKPGLNLSKVQLIRFQEGLCVQCMHIGPYDAEPVTVKAMDAYALQEGYALDLAGERRHHEIYLGDPRKAAPDKLKTVIRHPVRKA
ncbi:MAG: GyrI-like domain-containing protein [Anaerolineaceae bacterium]|nr:GyrI-like domain-containing protein [Anaerolineaceae bacterium]